MKISLGPKALAYPTPVFVVGTYDSNGRPNVMTVAWGGICCSKPPCVNVSVRKATHTYGSLIERKAFTVSIPSRDHVIAADYFGLASGRDEDKLAATGLTAVRSEVVDAPYVGEFPLVLECGITHVAELGSHVQFVGEILDVKAEESCLDSDGRPSAALVQPLTWASGENLYYILGESLAHGFSVGRSLRDKES